MTNDRENRGGRGFLRRVGSLIFRNFGYKLLALATAVLIWLAFGYL